MVQVCRNLQHRQNSQFKLMHSDGPEGRLTCDPVVQLEMILQASEYESAQGKNLQEFFDSTAGKFKTEVGKAWAAEIVARRRARMAEQPMQS